MKVISISQPFATLVVKGYKVFETRSWPAPASIIGETLGIASTKTVRPDARAHAEDPEFAQFYERLGLPALDELVCGHLLGTVTVDSCELMTEEFLEDVSREEKAYGWWQLGFYGWRLTHPRELKVPIAIRGAQGIYTWNGMIPSEEEEAAQTQADQAGSQRPQDIRRHLHVV